MPTWDAEVYETFADERGRPFADLLAQVDALGARLAQAYPARPWGTLLPFRRLFVVARKPGLEDRA